MLAFVQEKTQDLANRNSVLAWMIGLKLYFLKDPSEDERRVLIPSGSAIEVQRVLLNMSACFIFNEDGRKALMHCRAVIAAPVDTLSVHILLYNNVS